MFCTVEAPALIREALLASLRVKNPDFDANVHEPDEVPPHFEFFDKDDGKLFTGLATMFLTWAKQRGYGVDLVDWPFDPFSGWSEGLPQVDPNILPGIVLKEHQVDALRKALKYGRGVFDMATGSGKSEVAISITKSLGTPRTLYMVPDCASMHQMHERYLKRGFADGEVGRLGDALYEVDRPVVVAVINSVHSGIKTQDRLILDLLENCELFIADEVHHQGTAVTWQVVATQCKAIRRFGFSGTPYKDIRSRFNVHYIHPFDTFITGLLGPTLVYVSPSKLQEKGVLAPCQIISFPSGGETIPESPIFNKFQARAVWKRVYKDGIVENESRNDRICMLASNLADAGAFPLISVEVLEHGRNIQRKLWYEFGIVSVCSYGQGVRYVPKEFAEKYKIPLDEIPIFEEPKKRPKKGEKKPKPVQIGAEEDFVQISKRVDIFWHMQRGHIKVLVGSRIFDEALDVPFLSELINGAGGKADQRFRQKVGRVLRRSDGKGVARIWEPWDTCHTYLNNHSVDRLDSAAREKWPITTTERDSLDWIYELRASKLQLESKVTMKYKEIEVSINLTIPVNTNDPTDRFACIKPGVTLKADLEEGDNLDECMKKLSSTAKAHFLMEACRQAGTLGEIKKRGFVEATKEYLKQMGMATAS